MMRQFEWAFTCSLRWPFRLSTEASDALLARLKTSTSGLESSSQYPDERTPEELLLPVRPDGAATASPLVAPAEARIALMLPRAKRALLLALLLLRLLLLGGEMFSETSFAAAPHESAGKGRDGVACALTRLCLGRGAQGAAVARTLCLVCIQTARCSFCPLGVKLHNVICRGWHLTPPCTAAVEGSSPSADSCIPLDDGKFHGRIFALCAYHRVPLKGRRIVWFASHIRV